MNVSSTSFTCALLLAGMVGAGSIHWISVNDQVIRAMASPAPQMQLPAPVLLHPSTQQPILAQAQAEQELQNALKSIQADRNSVALSPALEEKLARVLTHMESMDKSQQDMRDQMAETNRDLMELQFRVDTHSESFRPLRATQESPFSNTPGVLPPRQQSE